MESVTLLDILIIFAYLIGMLWIGFYFTKKIKTSGDFFIAGRTLGPVVLMATVCASIIGGSALIGRGGYAYSGGMVAIAIALILDPDFVVCDEPVSALDVSVQAQVLNLLLDLRQQFGLTYLFISHDLNVVSYVSDRIGVMYLGNLVELGDGEAISQMPLHPYTEALFSASMEVEGDRDRIILSGDLPSPAHPPAGCPFHTRCFACEERCKTEKPQLREFEGGRFCACHLVEKRTGKKPVAHNEALEGNV